jgi:hypothetical protein
VGGGFLGDLPDAFDAVQFRRVGRQTEQLDAVPMVGEPLLAKLAVVVVTPMVAVAIFPEVRVSRPPLVAPCRAALHYVRMK